MNKKTPFIPLLLLVTLLSCSTEQSGKVASSASNAKDSSRLNIAVYPSQGCLPLYYAEAKGNYPHIMSFVHLNTMEDCDTALIHHSAHVAFTDLARLLCMRKDGFRATAVAQIPTRWTLFTAKGKRISTVKQLKERLVALARHSETDYLSDRMLQGTELEQLDVFRTQFNDHRLRMDMLTQGLVEGAFLDEPFATVARERGTTPIWESDTLQPGWAVLAVSTTLLSDSLQKAQVRQLIALYQQAAEELRTHPDTLLLNQILKRHYKLPHAEVDTLPGLLRRTALRQLPLQSVSEEAVQAAKAWLTNRKWITKSLKTDSLFTPQFFNQ